MAVVAIVAIAGQTWLPSRTRTAPVVRHVSPTVSILHQCTPMDRGKEGRKESLLPASHRLTVPCLADIQPAIAEREDRGVGRYAFHFSYVCSSAPPYIFHPRQPSHFSCQPFMLILRLLERIVATYRSLVFYPGVDPRDMGLKSVWWQKNDEVGEPQPEVMLNAFIAFKALYASTRYPKRRRQEPKVTLAPSRTCQP